MSRGNRHERGYGAAWDKLRAHILQRDKRLCRSCIRLGIIRTATDVDHIIRKADGGNDDESNLQSLCRSCHKDKTRAENAGIEAKVSGCNASGIPIDPGHHWGRG